MVGAIGLALMVAYVPGWSGAATTPRWDVGVAMALALLLGPAGRMTPAHGCGLAIAGWMILSLAWSSAPLDGIGAAVPLLVVAIAFAWGAMLDDIHPLVAGAAIGLAISSIIATAQWLGWHGIASADHAPAGLFYSRNRLGEAAAVVLAAAVGLRMWWALPGLVPALVLPMDRAAWIAAGVVVGLAAWRRARAFERYVAVVTIGWLAVLAWLMTSGLDMPWKLVALSERVTLWRFTIEHLTWLGHGLGAFITDGPVLAWPVEPGSSIVNASKAEHPHNEFLWLAYEGGLPAIGLFGAFAVLVWRSCSHEVRLVLVAIVVLACFAMPWHDPATLGLAGVCAGFGVGAARRHVGADDACRGALRAGLATGPGAGGELGGAGARGAAVSVSAAVS